ncbi:MULTISPECIES: C2H2-type zinc finger protein [Halorussus]|nr:MULTISPECIES: C2H2-type zinc finger protein [Halorussus]
MGNREDPGERGRYVCEACGESFASETELRDHLNAVGLVE